jgi:hypothetical protein
MISGLGGTAGTLSASTDCASAGSYEKLNVLPKSEKDAVLSTTAGGLVGAGVSEGIATAISVGFSAGVVGAAQAESIAPAHRHKIRHMGTMFKFNGVFMVIAFLVYRAGFLILGYTIEPDQFSIGRLRLV